VEISAAMGQKDPVPSASYCKQRNEGGVGYNIDLCLAAEQRAIDGLAGKVDLRAADDPDIARCVSEAASKLDSWAVLSSCLNRL